MGAEFSGVFAVEGHVFALANFVVQYFFSRPVYGQIPSVVCLFVEKVIFAIGRL